VTTLVYVTTLSVFGIWYVKFVFLFSV
jgi:hypothetical protein